VLDFSWLEAWLQKIRKNEEEGLGERVDKVEANARDYSAG